MLGRKSGAWQPTNPVQALPAWAFVARGAGFCLRVVQGGVSAAPIVASFRQSLDAHWARTKAIANGVVQDPNLTLSARFTVAPGLLQARDYGLPASRCHLSNCYDQVNCCCHFWLQGDPNPATPATAFVGEVAWVLTRAP